MAWEFFGVNFWSRDFFRFCWNGKGFFRVGFLPPFEHPPHLKSRVSPWDMHSTLNKTHLKTNQFRPQIWLAATWKNVSEAARVLFPSSHIFLTMREFCWYGTMGASLWLKNKLGGPSPPGPSLRVDWPLVPTCSTGRPHSVSVSIQIHQSAHCDCCQFKTPILH